MSYFVAVSFDIANGLPSTTDCGNRKRSKRWSHPQSGLQPGAKCLCSKPPSWRSVCRRGWRLDLGSKNSLASACSIDLDDSKEKQGRPDKRNPRRLA